MTVEQTNLVEDNLNLVWYVMRRYYPTTITSPDIEDFFQIGCIGLVQTAMNYDPEIGAFSTLAVLNIRGLLRHEFARRGRRKNIDEALSLDSSIRDDENNPSNLESNLPDIRYDPATRWYDDLGEFESLLTENQKNVFRAMLEEKNSCEISEELGYSRQYIQQTRKRIQNLFGNFYSIPGFENVDIAKRGRPRKEKK